MPEDAAPKSAKISELKQLATISRDLPEVSVGLTTLAGFDLIQRAGKVLASSSLVPAEYQGNLPNCIIALNMAYRIGADPLMILQNLFVVYGRPSWSSQFLIATFNTCGRFSSLHYEFFGEKGTDEWGCRAWAVEKATGEKLVGTDVTLAIARREGWFEKNGSKWQTIPQQMLTYRAASWFVRAYAPEIAMGLHTREEVEDSVIDVEPAFNTSLGELRGSNEMPSKQDKKEDVPAVDTAKIAELDQQIKAETKPDIEALKKKISQPVEVDKNLDASAKHPEEQAYE